MKKMLCVVTAIVLAAGVSAAAQKDADAAAIAKIRADYEKATNARDFAAIARLYTADGVEMPPNGPAAKGRAAIEAMNKKMATSMNVTNLKIVSTDTHISGDTAYDVGTYTQRITPKGGPAIDDRGKFVVVLRKTGGSWGVAYAIYNSDLPPPPGPPSAPRRP